MQEAKEVKQSEPFIFKIEGNVAPRIQVREISKNAEYMKKIDLSIIRIRPDEFNARIKPDSMTQEMWNHVLMIPDLADGIFANNGPAEPIIGDFHKDGNFYITNGERRYRALLHLIATGRDLYPNHTETQPNPVKEVLVLINPPGTTDLERKVKMYATNDNLPFTPMQKAHYFASFEREPYCMTHEQIADMFKMSRQNIDNYILATTLDKSVQDQIDEGTVKITNALAELRKKKAEAKKKSSQQGDDEPPIITGTLADKMEKEEKEKEKLRGDEDDFIQQDNSITFAGSKQGPPEDKSSGAVVIGKDSIYHKPIS